MSELYLGLMSGTSVDGIDAGLVDFNHGKLSFIDFVYLEYSSEIRAKIQQLSQPQQNVRLQDYGTVDAELGELFATTALNLLEKTNVPASEIKAIGSHGQTVYHSPGGKHGFSLQISDPNRIAQITGITTIADFRRRDIAAGGQGAPLVPAFHQALFADPQQNRTVLNIGGIANISILNSGQILGFDTGPGNTLLNYWCQKHRHQPYDQNGDWGASGQAQAQLLAELSNDEYFCLPPPKSTGPEYFSASWLEEKLKHFPTLKPEDIQATLCEFTAASIAEAIKQYSSEHTEILACGGGVHNRQLMRLLAENLHKPVLTTDTFGIHPDHVEACAFAWLARQTLLNLPGNLCSVTGANTPMILGGIYPGKYGLLR